MKAYFFNFILSLAQNSFICLLSLFSFSSLAQIDDIEKFHVALINTPANELREVISANKFFLNKLSKRSHTDLQTIAYSVSFQDMTDVKAKFQLLLEAGANPNIQNPYGKNTPAIFLHQVARYHKFSQETVATANLFLKNEKWHSNLLAEDKDIPLLSDFLYALKKFDYFSQKTLNPHAKEILLTLIEQTEIQQERNLNKGKVVFHGLLAGKQFFYTEELKQLLQIFLETADKNPQLKHNVLFSFVFFVFKRHIFQKNSATPFLEQFLDLILKNPKMNSPENKVLLLEVLLALQRWAITQKNFNPNLLSFFKLAKAKGVDFSLITTKEATILSSFTYNSTKYNLFKSGISPAAKEFFKFLLENKKIINIKGNLSGKTSLKAFVHDSFKTKQLNESSLEVTKMMIDAGADVSVLDDYGGNALSSSIHSVFKNDLFINQKMKPSIKQLLNLLAEKTDMRPPISMYSSQLFQYVLFMLKHDRINRDTLHILKTLLKNKTTDVNGKNTTGSTALLITSSFLDKGTRPLTKNFVNLVKELLEAGADLLYENNSKIALNSFESFFEKEKMKLGESENLNQLQELVRSHSCSRQFQP